ncbi:HAD-IA family hydrolase [Brenneria sp. g21c3]|uniref:HAD family hydrolase n=1 Tax=Brenneria sp. g21c3 TaxID=3093893 RepID=UPI002EC257F9|nr:HAD-IA family hydrolase [Brenneria sp. g21c3]
MNRPDLLIFDCDGVLIDSEIIGINLTRSLLKQHGVDIGLAEFAAEYSGLLWDDLINKVKSDKRIDIPASIHQDFYRALLKQFEEKLTRIPGSYEAISEIAARKCICSNSSTEQLNFTLALVGLTPLFSPNIFSAVDLGPGRSKPQPDIFLHAAEAMQATPGNTIVIEDSVHGVTGAKKAGMYVIGFTGGSHTYSNHQEKLRAAGADVVINSMHQLSNELARFGRRAVK